MRVPAGARAPLAVAAAALTCVACAHAPLPSRVSSDLEGARRSAVVADAETLSPGALAHAEALRLESRTLTDRDDVSADLLAERTMIAYERTVLLARLARATVDADRARTAAAAAGAEAERLAAARAGFEAKSAATSNELSILRNALPRLAVTPDPAREAARATAARAMLAEGELLCGAARLLVTAPETRLDAAERAVVTARDEGSSNARRGAGGAIDAATSARSACLEALTLARREGPTDTADRLLASLSARGDLDPTRDERGVVVTLRGAFKGVEVTPDAARLLAELGRVAAANGAVPVQLVLHDASPPGEDERRSDETRLRAAEAALASGWGGSQVPHAHAALGARLPASDPLASSPSARARNARLDVVFVTRGG